jgi:hypothetical protein
MIPSRIALNLEIHLQFYFQIDAISRHHPNAFIVPALPPQINHPANALEPFQGVHRLGKPGPVRSVCVRRLDPCAHDPCGGKPIEHLNRRTSIYEYYARKELRKWTAIHPLFVFSILHNIRGRISIDRQGGRRSVGTKPRKQTAECLPSR